jgi:hypothetical protein
MSVSEQEIKARVDQMQQDLDEAKQARKRSAFTKVVGTILAIIIVSVFVWSFLQMGFDIAETLGGTDEEGVTGFEQILTDIGEKQRFEQFQMRARNIVREQARQTLEEARTDPEIRQMFDNLMNDVAMPAAQQAIREHQTELAAALETQADQWIEDLRDRVEQQVETELRPIVEREVGRLLEETDLNEEEVQQVMTNIREVAQQAVEDMVAKRLEDWETEIKAIQQARSTIVADAQMPEDIEEYNPVYVLLKLLGYKLQDLDIKSDADLQDTLRTTAIDAVQ